MTAESPSPGGANPPYPSWASANAQPPALARMLVEPPPAERILVIRLGALGDVVRTRFAFAALRELYPGARIDWLVEDRAAAALEGLTGLDEIVSVERPRLRARHPLRLLRAVAGVVERLRASSYDLSIDFHGMLKSAIFPWRAGIPRRVGYAGGIARDGSSWLLTDRVDFTPVHVPRFERNAALVRYLGGRGSTAPVVAPAPANADGPSRNQLVMHPGTSQSTLYKRWEPEGYAAVARSLKEQAGVDSLVAWGPVEGERETAQAVVDAAAGAAQLAPETASVGEVLELLRGARLFVGSDSGPMHLATLAGLPVVALFGPTDPTENAPYPSAPQLLLRHDIGCNPCRLGCPERPCMARIRPDEVVAAALELLRK